MTWVYMVHPMSSSLSVESFSDKKSLSLTASEILMLCLEPRLKTPEYRSVEFIIIPVFYVSFNRAKQENVPRNSFGSLHHVLLTIDEPEFCQ